MKKASKCFAKIALCAAALIFTAIICAGNILPNSYQVIQGDSLRIKGQVKITAEYAGKNGENTVPVGLSQVGNRYNVNLKLFGIFPIKEAGVQVVNEVYVLPGGTPFGIKIFTQGVMIVGMTDVDTENGLANPAEMAGLRLGDVVLKIGEEQVNSNEEIAARIEKSAGKELDFTVRRGEDIFTASFVPLKSQSEDKYKAGIWVRDSSAGIGTMTFYEPRRGIYGGLGHAICDVDTGEILPLMSGEIVSAQIGGVTQGENGAPGELHGRFIEGGRLGSLLLNCETGVYGEMEYCPDYSEDDLLPIAMKQEVVEGGAQIISTIDTDTPEYYDCEIEKIFYDEEKPTQNMVINITDPELLGKTGGIVQGMSGSPIIQNGKLVGAVTHVYVNDPTRGYGIFAENMETTMNTVETRILNKAS